MRKPLAVILFAALAVAVILSGFLLPRRILENRLLVWLEASGAQGASAEVSAAGLRRATVTSFAADWPGLQLAGEDIQVNYRLLGRADGETPLSRVIASSLSVEQTLDPQSARFDPAVPAALAAGLLHAAGDALSVEQGRYRLLLPTASGGPADPGQPPPALDYDFNFSALRTTGERSFRAEFFNDFSRLDASGSLNPELSTVTLLFKSAQPLEHFRPILEPELRARSASPAWPDWLPRQWPAGLESVAALDLDLSLEGADLSDGTTPTWAVVLDAARLRWSPAPGRAVRLEKLVGAARLAPDAPASVQAGASVEGIDWEGWSAGSFSANGRLRGNQLRLGAMPFTVRHRSTGLQLEVRDFALTSSWLMDGIVPVRPLKVSGAAEVQATWAELLESPSIPVRFTHTPGALELEFHNVRLRHGHPACSLILGLDLAGLASPPPEGIPVTIEILPLAGQGGPSGRWSGRVRRDGNNPLAPIRLTGEFESIDQSALALIDPARADSLPPRRYSGSLDLLLGLAGLKILALDIDD